MAGMARITNAAKKVAVEKKAPNMPCQPSRTKITCSKNVPIVLAARNTPRAAMNHEKDFDSVGRARTMSAAVFFWKNTSKKAGIN